AKAAVAAAALDAGASLINDVSAFRADPEMAALVADRGAECVLMHMRGEPRTMQEDPRYADVVDDVKAFLHERLAFAVREGVREFERGARVFRVHDVAPVREALAVAAATLGGGWTARSTQKTPTS